MSSSRIARIFLFNIISLAIIFLILFVSSVNAQNQNTYQFDYLIVVDTSGSMVGKGAGNPAVIFPKVKREICSFIDTIDEGALVYILPFHKGIQRTYSTTIQSKSDKASLKRFVNNLQATGQVTWIYQTLNKSLNIAKSLRKNDTKQHIQVILLFTDGLDNGPENLTFDEIMDRFELETSDNEFLYLKYITLGVDLPPGIEKRLERTKNVQLIQEPKGTVSPYHLVEIRPYILNFGNMLKKKTSKRTLNFVFEKRLYGKEMAADIYAEEIFKKGALLQIQPSKFPLKEFVDFNLSVLNKELLVSEKPPWLFEGKVRFKPAQEKGQFIFIIPSELTLQFEIAPEKTIRIWPVNSQAENLNLGTINFPEGGKFQTEAIFAVAFNEAAKLDNARLTVKLQEVKAEKQLTSLPVSLSRTTKSKGSSQIELGPEDDSFVLLFDIDRSLKPGNYSFDLICTPQKAEISSKVLNKYKYEEGSFSTRINFEIPPPPLPIWLQIILCLLFALIVLIITFVIVVVYTANKNYLSYSEVAQSYLSKINNIIRKTPIKTGIIIINEGAGNEKTVTLQGKVSYSYPEEGNPVITFYQKKENPYPSFRQVNESIYVYVNDNLIIDDNYNLNHNDIIKFQALDETTTIRYSAR